MNRITHLCFITLAWLLLSGSHLAQAQTTAFTYQGRLTETGNPANNNYDLQFKLFDTPTVGVGTQAGATLVRNPVAVSAGVFTVTLDFGANVFTGATRYLEIGVRPAGSAIAYTILAPRQPITSTPYAIQTLNAQQLGGLPASGFVQNTTTPQAGANLNIGGNATMASLNVNGPASFGGVAAPAVAPAGQGRLYFDAATNKLKLSENGGAFVNLVGATGVGGSGMANTIPLWNAGTTLGNSAISQLGTNIGIGSTTPLHRLAIGSGPAWTTHGWGGLVDMENASAIGWRANSSNLRLGIGHTNDGLLFFRTASELGNSASQPLYDFKIDNLGNAGLGNLALSTDLSGAKLTVFTNSATYGLVQSDGMTTVGTFVGATGGWFGTRSNHPLNFFTNNGSPQMTLLTNGNVGIGTTPSSFDRLLVRSTNSTGTAITGRNESDGFGVYGEATGNGVGVFGQAGSSTTGWAGFFSGRVHISDNFGIGTITPQRLLHVNGQARIGSIPPGGSFSNQVCFTAEGDLLQCTSSLRYKTNVQPFLGGLQTVRRLRPITFNWKENGQPDIGLGAEDVAKVAPSFVSTNSKGEIVSVNYAGLSALFINAFKEQQTQIETLRAANAALQERLRAVEKVLRKKAGATRRRR